MRHGLLPAAALALAGCTHRLPPPTLTTATPHYVVGAAYQLRGTWHYPQEQFEYDATGLAEREPVHDGPTADGEMDDAFAMVGSHPTLQLPAIVDVTNLANGHQVRIRLNDRGPANPDRLLGLGPRPAELLGLPEHGAAPVRIELASEASQALRDRLGGGPKGLTAAPLTKVLSEALPPPGRSPSGTVRVAADAPAELAVVAGPIRLDPLPQTVRQVAVSAGQLWVRAGSFTARRYAEALKNKLSAFGAQVQRMGDSRQPGYLVMAGPFASIPSADAALDQVRRSGVTDATIVVE